MRNLLLLIALCVVAVASCVNCGDSGRTVAPTPTRISVDRSPEKQAFRLEYIEKMKALGVIYKITTLTKYPRLYVTDLFMAQDIDSKEILAGAVLTYYYAKNSEATMLVIKHSRTGKQVGTCYMDGGLKMD